MSKQGSEVAFIPDNISNISSGKEKFNEDTSQKIEDSYISKLTKFQNPNIDTQNGLQIVDIKAPSPQKYELREDADPKEIVEVIAKKLAMQNMRVEYVNPNTQKQPQKKLILHKYIKQPMELPATAVQIKRHHLHQSDNTYLQGKHTQTDVISEKESFVEEQHDVSMDENRKPSQHNIHFDNIVHYDSVQQSQKISKKKNSSVKDKDYTDDLKETFYVTQVNKYDEFETEIGWLEHCVDGNVKHLLRQTNQLLDYNNAVMIEIEKVQLRTKIIELQIETNKLKIALRKSPSSKHINFSVDLKLKRPTVLRIPKKIDLDMRKYCMQLEKTVSELRNMYESNQKELSLLDFYQKQFEQKVNYAYIYQEYLIERAKKELMSNTVNVGNLKNSPKKRNKKMEDSFNFTLSPNKKQKVLLKDSSRNITSKKSNKSSQREIDQSTTSLAKKLNNKNNTSRNKHLMKLNKAQVNAYGDSDYAMIRNSKSTSNFIRHTDSEYYTQPLDKTTLSPNKHNLSISKKVSLTHHKDLTLPSNQRFIQLSNGQIDQSFLPLFNTPNRQKKHFYYECQMYLKQLQKDYLCQCQSQKRNVLLTNQNGFRQRELLKMKTQQIKNEILDTEVDVVSKQKELHKENQILKRQLQLLENQLFTKYHGQYDLEGQKKMKKTIRSPVKLKNLLPNEYDLLYKQAQRRLQNYKSTNMLQSVRPNIPKSPKKITSQKSLQNITSLQKLTFAAKDNKILHNNHKANQRQDVKTVKKSGNFNDRKMSKSPVIVRLKSSSRSKKFLNRFKINLTQDFLNMTVKQNSQSNSESKKPNPETTVATERPNGINISIPQAEFIEEEYYAV